ncbi:MAG: hypothetical protein Q8M92_05395 [Candidatus Subteraquimicrobiales bacterium]|nr:hypothetical protein [Candidatus Subteraquimicrobiales bacterium]
MMKFASIRNKILLPFLAMAVIVTFSVFLVSTLFSHQLGQEFEKRMVALNTLSANSFSQEEAYLRLHAEILAEVLFLNNAFAPKKEGIIQEILISHAKDYGLNYAVFGERGELLAKAGDFFDSDDLSSFNPIVKRGFLKEKTVSACPSERELSLRAVYPLLDSNVLHGVVLAASLIDKKFL